MASTHRLLRHPSFPDDPPPAKRARVEVDGRLCISDPDARARALAHWASLKTYVRSAVGGLRTLLFIHSADTRVCLRLRGLLNRRYWTLAFFALQMQRSMPTKSLKVLTEELEGLACCFPSKTDEKKGKQVDESPIKRVFAALLVYLFRHADAEFMPLYDKLSVSQRATMDGIFNDRYLNALTSDESVQDLHQCGTWFNMDLRAPCESIGIGVGDLEGLPHTAAWDIDRAAHQERQRSHAELLDRQAQQAEMRALRTTMAKQRTSRRAKELWSSKDEEQHEQEVSPVKLDQRALQSDDKMLLVRTIKIRMMPTHDQQKVLAMYMAACRWTYNQGVAHFRLTTDYNAHRLQQLYVTKTSKKKQVYPDRPDVPADKKLGSAPEWVLRVPADMRKNALCKLQTAVKAAYSNFENGNINSFTMKFSSRKLSRLFTIQESARSAKIYPKKIALPPAEENPGEGTENSLLAEKFYLQITGLKDIRVLASGPVSIDGAVEICNQNGFWYLTVPQYAQPSELDGLTTCIALDPGIKCFLTGMDLDGNILEIGRGTKEHLDHLREIRDNARSAIARYKNIRGRTTHQQHKDYARAMRAFNSANARMKNAVKELHYKAAELLTSRYQTIILPRFQTKEMVRRSCARNHAFNTSMLSLNHFKFRQLLKAKCEVKGRSLVVCSEMYTSRTCGRCNHLHLRLGSKDVFKCPTAASKLAETRMPLSTSFVMCVLGRWKRSWSKEKIQRQSACISVNW